LFLDTGLFAPMPSYGSTDPGDWVEKCFPRLRFLPCIRVLVFLSSIRVSLSLFSFDTLLTATGWVGRRAVNFFPSFFSFFSLYFYIFFFSIQHSHSYFGGGFVIFLFIAFQCQISIPNGGHCYILFRRKWLDWKDYIECNIENVWVQFRITITSQACGIVCGSYI